VASNARADGRKSRREPFDHIDWKPFALTHENTEIAQEEQTIDVPALAKHRHNIVKPKLPNSVELISQPVGLANENHLKTVKLLSKERQVFDKENMIFISVGLSHIDEYKIPVRVPVFPAKIGLLQGIRGFEAQEIDAYTVDLEDLDNLKTIPLAARKVLVVNGNETDGMAREQLLDWIVLKKIE